MKSVFNVLLLFGQQQADIVLYSLQPYFYTHKQFELDSDNDFIALITFRTLGQY